MYVKAKTQGKESELYLAGTFKRSPCHIADGGIWRHVTTLAAEEGCSYRNYRLNTLMKEGELEV